LRYPLPNDRILSEEDLKYLQGKSVDGEYLPAKKISAHCYFTESDPWLTRYDLNLDRSINFWGEEFYQSSLAYARGYNLVWHPKNIMYHNYGSNVSRSYEENLHKPFENIYDVIDIYNSYIKNSTETNGLMARKNFEENDIVDSLNTNYFGYLPRSIKGFLKYSKIDLINRKTSAWWEVPDINVIYP
jgi:hypothetical protein